jgi:hypothetical protein
LLRFGFEEPRESCPLLEKKSRESYVMPPARQPCLLVLLLPLCLLPAQAQTNTRQEGMPPPTIAPSGMCAEAPREDALPSLCAPPSSDEAEQDAARIQVQLTLPAGTPLRIAIDQRIRISREGEIVRGKVSETVYAFDQPVIPAGSEATGRVTRIDAVPAKRRIFSYANGDFTPFREYQVTFDTVTLPDGKQIAIQTTVSRGVQEMVHLVSHPEKEQEKKRSAVARAVDSTRQEAQNTFHEGVDQIRSPGRFERLKRLVVRRLPYRRQYVEPGTRFNASLNAPLDFGVTTRTAEQLALLGTAPAPESLMRARLLLEVSSGTATRGTPVVAVLTQPVLSADHRVVLPAESLLIGQVLQARAARKLHRNGSLRVIFEHIETPEGRLQPVQGSLEGIEVDRAAGMRLDEEGGAHTTNSKTRYLSTGLAVAMAAVAARPDTERGVTDPGGDPAVRAGAGSSGLGLAGGLISLAAKSTPISVAFGVYGASSSVYANFLSRGHEVVFPKDTPLEIAFGSPHPSPQATKQKR